SKRSWSRIVAPSRWTENAAGAVLVRRTAPLSRTASGHAAGSPARAFGGATLGAPARPTATEFVRAEVRLAGARFAVAARFLATVRFAGRFFAARFRPPGLARARFFAPASAKRFPVRDVP